MKNATWLPLLLLALSLSVFKVHAGDTFYYGELDGTILLTNVPSGNHLRPLRHEDNRHFPRKGPTPFADIIREAAIKAGLNEDLLSAIIAVESDFRPRAVSPKGAMGLMQLMPDTAEALGVTRPFDPRENVLGGARHLRSLLDRFGGDLELALAAYNAGEQRVRERGTVPPFPETRRYVDQIMARLPPSTRSRSVREARSPGPVFPQENRFFIYVDENGFPEFTDIPKRMGKPTR